MGQYLIVSQEQQTVKPPLSNPMYLLFYVCSFQGHKSQIQGWFMNQLLVLLKNPLNGVLGVQGEC